MATKKEIQQFEGQLQSLKNSIQLKNFAPVYLLHGEEAYFIDQVEHLFLKHVLSESEKSFNETIYYGKDTEPEDIVDQAQRFPMMAERQLVVVREAQELKSLDPIEAYVAQPTPSTVLVLCYKYGAIPGTRKIVKHIKKQGVVLKTLQVPDYEMSAWISRYFQRKNIHIETKEASLLADYLGNQLSKVENELEKLILNLPEGSKVTTDAIERYIGISKDYNIFELQDAFADRDVEKAMRIAYHFAANPKQNPIQMLIGSLFGFYSKLYILHGVQGKSPKEVQQAVGIYNEFILNKYRQAARQYSKKSVEAVFDLLFEYDLRAKGIITSEPVEGLIKELVYRIFHAGAKVSMKS